MEFYIFIAFHTRTPLFHTGTSVVHDQIEFLNRTLFT